MKGIGVSLVDNEPKEILFVSVHKLSFLIEKVRLIQSMLHAVD